MADVYLHPQALIVPISNPVANVQGTFQLDRFTGLGMMVINDENGTHTIDIGTALAMELIKAANEYSPPVEPMKA
jgi:hypothetical protein